MPGDKPSKWNSFKIHTSVENALNYDLKIYFENAFSFGYSLSVFQIPHQMYDDSHSNNTLWWIAVENIIWSKICLLDVVLSLMYE